MNEIGENHPIASGSKLPDGAQDTGVLDRVAAAFVATAGAFAGVPYISPSPTASPTLQTRARLSLRTRTML
ncbi:hypothetical protein PG993_011115 [Apiospora rasikravindrae]|uniref:Uncharacterized protein n=1 Tax=Apiospora rasikravindrae TaxID=990691 RepID=A0ABR1SDA6_9PEZI